MTTNSIAHHADHPTHRYPRLHLSTWATVRTGKELGICPNPVWLEALTWIYVDFIKRRVRPAFSIMEGAHIDRTSVQAY